MISFGVSFDLSASHPELLEQGLNFLPLGCKPYSAARSELKYRLQAPASSGMAVPYQLRRNGRQVFASVDRQELLERFQLVVSLDVAERSNQYTFVHAGVVGWANFAIVIPGRSFAGKSTLVAALICAGASYYSDEFAVIDMHGKVHPYARPLQMREHGRREQISRAVEEFGGKTAVSPLPIKLVLVTRFTPGAGWRPKLLTPGIGLLKLLDNTVSARRSPATALHRLKQVVIKAETLRSSRGEASQVVNWLSANFGPAQGRRNRAS